MRCLIIHNLASGPHSDEIFTFVHALAAGGDEIVMRCIGAGMERLLLKAKSVDCWGGKAPNILVVAPPCIKDGFHDAVMGAGCVEKSRGVAEQLRIVAERQGVHFMDAAECEFNEVDFMHLTCKGHARLAELLTAEVPKLI